MILTFVFSFDHFFCNFSSLGQTYHVSFFFHSLPKSLTTLTSESPFQMVISLMLFVLVLTTAAIQLLLIISPLLPRQLNLRLVQNFEAFLLTVLQILPSLKKSVCLSPPKTMISVGLTGTAAGLRHEVRQFSGMQMLLHLT